jgi:GT2 family glycosyltransferase
LCRHDGIEGFLPQDRHGARTAPGRRAEARLTDLSVVIATYNRAERLRNCLDALGGQTADGGIGPEDFEVVVVVDGSTDSTRELLAMYRAPYALKVFWQENSGQPTAANRGVAQATGRFCLLMDDDILARPGMLAEHLRAQRESGGLLGAGRLTLRMPEDADWYARGFAADWARHYARLDDRSKTPTAAACYGNNLSFPREAFQAVGGFAVDFARGYDLDLAIRLIAAGLTVRYLPRAEAVQDERKGWRQLLRDKEAAGAAVLALFRREPSTLPLGGLADFHRGSPVEIASRRLLLALRVPVFPLGAVGSLFDRLSRARWYRFVRAYAFWRGVRRAASAEEWARLTSVA